MATCGWPMSCSFPCTTSKLADVEKAWKHFRLYESECKGLLEEIRVDLDSLKADAGAVWPAVAMADGGKAAMAQVLRSPIVGRLRPLLEMLAPVQHSGCARSDFGDRARGRDRAGASVGGGDCEGLGGSAKEPTQRPESASEQSDEPEPVSQKKPKAKKEALSPVV